MSYKPQMAKLKELTIDKQLLLTVYWITRDRSYEKLPIFEIINIFSIDGVYKIEK